MLARKSTFKASKTMVHRVENTPNIEIIFNVEVKDVLGDGVKFNSVHLFNNIRHQDTTLDVTGFFVAIGHHPNTDIFKPWITMDDAGYVKTKSCSTNTNIPGIFCCGDAQDPHYRQAVTAAGKWLHGCT